MGLLVMVDHPMKLARKFVLAILSFLWKFAATSNTL